LHVRPLAEAAARLGLPLLRWCGSGPDRAFLVPVRHRTARSVEGLPSGGAPPPSL